MFTSQCLHTIKMHYSKVKTNKQYAVHYLVQHISRANVHNNTVKYIITGGYRGPFPLALGIV